MSWGGTLATVVFLLTLACVPARAQSDPDEIKRLRDAGEILPLQLIIDKLPAPHRGERLLEAELELLGDGRYVYELKTLSSDGTVWELQYDARTAEILKINGEH
jgi:uncharacterized membrane protein YkoI